MKGLTERSNPVNMDRLMKKLDEGEQGSGYVVRDTSVNMGSLMESLAIKRDDMEADREAAEAAARKREADRVRLHPGQYDRMKAIE